jgi:hypothetical protein
MDWGRVTATELMPRLVGGDTETVCGKWKRGKGFLKPNFELGPKARTGSLQVPRVELTL